MRPSDPNRSQVDIVAYRAVRELFDTLNRQGIRYCHWKSNLRLEAGLNGRTDLDLLVDPDHRQAFRHILRDHHALPVRAPRGRRYPDLEDYLGFDADRGGQVHLHVHYRLILGEQFVKNYHLPLEPWFLDTCRMSLGVKIPAPEAELAVLSLRALLKYRDRDMVKDVLDIRTPGIPDHIRSEIDWLRGQTTTAALNQALHAVDHLIPADIILEFLRVMANTPRNGRALFQLRQRLRQALGRHQRHGRVRATTIYARELWRRRNTFLKFSPTPRMTLPNRGLTLALVGIDGSGKTTHARIIRRWLDWKLDARGYYLGSKQPSRPSRYAYLFFRMARRTHTELTARSRPDRLLNRAIAGVRDALLYTHYLFTGIDRLRRCRAGARDAAAGRIVVYDRFPLRAPLDGPQIHLAHGRGSRLKRAFARVEQRLYAHMPPPDLLLILQVTPDVSLQRKPDHDRAAILEKHQVLTNLLTVLQTNGSQPILIDTEMPLNEVVRALKCAIWHRLDQPTAVQSPSAQPAQSALHSPSPS